MACWWRHISNELRFLESPTSRMSWTRNDFFLLGLIGDAGVHRGAYSILPALIWSMAEKVSIDVFQPLPMARSGGPESSCHMPLAIFHKTCILLKVSKWQLLRSDWFLPCWKKKMFSLWANSIISKQENVWEQIFSVSFLSNLWACPPKGWITTSLPFGERAGSALQSWAQPPWELGSGRDLEWSVPVLCEHRQTGGWPPPQPGPS